MCSAKLFEHLETSHSVGVVAVLVVGQFEPILSVGTWDKGQSDVRNMHRRGGLTFVDTVHLECPPAKFSKLVKRYTPLSLLLPICIPV